MYNCFNGLKFNTLSTLFNLIMARSSIFMKYDFLFKVLVIGDSGVGKSCIMVRFTEDEFNESFISTIGIDFKVKTIDVNGVTVKLQIWDTAGQERFHTITAHYFRGAMGVMLVYDVCDSSSFINIKKWMRSIQKDEGFNGQIMILGNKCDRKDRVISKGRGEVIANEYGVRYMETSAKENINIDESFMAISKMILDKIQNNKEETELNLETASGNKSLRQKCCTK